VNTIVNKLQWNFCLSQVPDVVMGYCTTFLPVVNVYSIGWCCSEGQSRL